MKLIYFIFQINYQIDNSDNQGTTNSVDNTWGDFTIQEGESDLFLINNQ